MQLAICTKEYKKIYPQSSNCSSFSSHLALLLKNKCYGWSSRLTINIHLKPSSISFTTEARKLRTTFPRLPDCYRSASANYMHMICKKEVRWTPFSCCFSWQAWLWRSGIFLHISVQSLALGRCRKECCRAKWLPNLWTPGCSWNRQLQCQLLILHVPN